MSAHLVIVILALLAAAAGYSAVLVLGVRQLPTPLMRHRSHAGSTHRQRA